MRMRWGWDEDEMRMRWGWDEDEMRMRWQWVVNVNVRHTYCAPLNPVTEVLHAVELTLFLWHIPEGVAEQSFLGCNHQSTCMPSYSFYVQLLWYPMYYPGGMKARVSHVQWSEPHSILVPTQDSNPGGRIQNHKRWPLHYHCTHKDDMRIRLGWDKDEMRMRWGWYKDKMRTIWGWDKGETRMRLIDWLNWYFIAIPRRYYRHWWMCFERLLQAFARWQHGWKFLCFTKFLLDKWLIVATVSKDFFKLLKLIAKCFVIRSDTTK